jgi:hypothetical protein
MKSIQSISLLILLMLSGQAQPTRAANMLDTEAPFLSEMNFDTKDQAYEEIAKDEVEAKKKDALKRLKYLKKMLFQFKQRHSVLPVGKIPLTQHQQSINNSLERTYVTMDDFFSELKKSTSRTPPHPGDHPQAKYNFFSKELDSTINMLLGLSKVDAVTELDNLRLQMNESLLVLVQTSLPEPQSLNYRVGKFRFESANDACFLFSAPGDILLRKAYNLQEEYADFSPKLLSYIKILEVLKGSDTHLDYRHAELITKLTSGDNIESLSFYPPSFNRGKPEEEKMPKFLINNNKYQGYLLYRSRYAIVRVLGVSAEKMTQRKQEALARAEQMENYHTRGTCADFINWTYKNIITSKWNFIPGIKNLIPYLYMPEAIQTPDDIAESYMTKKVCDVENAKLVFPMRKPVASWLRELQADRRSNNQAVKTHAQRVIDELIKQRIISFDESPLFDVLETSVETPNLGI